jgi:CRP/FNR family transcriptional regulator
MQTDILIKRLGSSEFLRGLDETALALLARNAAWKVFAPEAVVLWEGDNETNLCYLHYGLLKILKASPDGREQVLRHVQAGEIFNEVGVLAKRPNPARAVALEESGIWLIPRQSIEEMLLANPRMALQIIESMAVKFTDLVSLAADLSLKSVKARFASLLLEQAEGSVIERRSWSTQAEMASRLGTVSDVLSRIIREWTKAGIIEMDKQQIRILDQEGLLEQAQTEKY